MPTEFNLGFAKMIILYDDLAELIVNNDVELNLDMVNTLHQELRSNLTSPFYLLVNKSNDYSYDFTAQHELGTLDELKAIAIVCYTEKSKKSTNFISALPRKKQWNVEIFNNREDSLKWLKQQKSIFS